MNIYWAVDNSKAIGSLRAEEVETVYKNLFKDKDTSELQYNRCPAFKDYFNNVYGNIYAICLLFTVEIPLILSIFFLRKNPTSSGCAMISWATKWITLGGMVTILCSSL